MSMLVMDTGNPWVIFTLSLPVSISTRTHESWVRVLTGFPLGTGMGIIPRDMGMDFLLIYIMFILINKNLEMSCVSRTHSQLNAMAVVFFLVG